MGDVAHRESIETLRVGGGCGPGDDAAPVVADQVGARLTGDGDQIDQVGHEVFEPVRRDPAGRLGVGVAPKIRGEHTEAGRCECGDLASPRVPEVREAMQQYHQRALARLDEVHVEGVDGPPVVGDQFVDRRDGHGRPPSRRAARRAG